MAAFSYNNYSPPSLFLVSDPLSNIIPNASNYLHQSSPVLQNDPINSISDQSVITHHSLHSTSPTSLSMEITQQLERKRKKSDSYKAYICSELIAMWSRDECKWKKQKQCGEGMSKSRQDKVENRERAKIGEAEYIHVRARRGEATDSHSLAERVRREKISQRMRLLQSLVPGCDKIKGKALILDEIISYIQSLQNHVEFLAEKLASVYPMLNDFEMDLELNTLTTEQMPEKFSQLGSCIFSCHTI